MRTDPSRFGVSASTAHADFQNRRIISSLWDFDPLYQMLPGLHGGKEIPLHRDHKEVHRVTQRSNAFLHEPLCLLCGLCAIGFANSMTLALREAKTSSIQVNQHQEVRIKKPELIRIQLPFISALIFHQRWIVFTIVRVLLLPDRVHAAAVLPVTVSMVNLGVTTLQETSG
jgi:hypothetical protein